MSPVTCHENYLNWMQFFQTAPSISWIQIPETNLKNRNNNRSKPQGKLNTFWRSAYSGSVAATAGCTLIHVWRPLAGKCECAELLHWEGVYTQVVVSELSHLGQGNAHCQCPMPTRHLLSPDRGIVNPIHLVALPILITIQWIHEKTAWPCSSSARKAVV